jgi:hypothetical protein
MLNSQSPIFSLFRWILSKRALVLAAVLPATVFSPQALSQVAAPTADVLVLANGDQLTGKLLRESNGTVSFHSDMAGDLSFTWDKIKSIRTTQKFAVIEQGQHISRKTPDSNVAQGTLAIQGDTIQVAGKEISEKNAQYLVDQDSYIKQVRGNHGWGYGWGRLVDRWSGGCAGYPEQPHIYRSGNVCEDYSRSKLDGSSLSHDGRFHCCLWFAFAAGRGHHKD